jgi:glycosyltransferase involved in cell wall biosynthesis
MSNLLSICIPTFNRFKHLDETLNNITNLSQSHNFVNEILIIDNNECNKASKIVSQYSQRFKKIKYIKNEKNIGPENNFKKCILRAESKYVWLIADDDLLFNNSFDIVSKKMKEEFDFLLINWSVYDNDINDSINDSVLPMNIKFSSNKNFILENFSSKLSFISSTIFKKDLFDNQAIKLFDKFIPHQLSFLIFIYHIVRNDDKDFIYEEAPLIKQRGDNDPFLGNNVENFYRVFSDGISLFHKELILMKYNQKSINRSLRESFKTFIFKDLLSRKINRDDFHFAHNSALKNYGHLFELRIIILLISIIPSSLLNLFKIIKNLFK